MIILKEIFDMKSSIVFLFCFIILFPSLVASQVQTLLENGKTGSFMVSSSVKVEVTNVDGSLNVSIQIPFEKWLQFQSKKIKVLSEKKSNSVDWEYNKPLEIIGEVAKIESPVGTFKTTTNTALKMVIRKPANSNESGNIQLTMKSGGMSCYFGDGNFFSMLPGSDSSSWRVGSRSIGSGVMFGNSSEFSTGNQTTHTPQFHHGVNNTLQDHIPASNPNQTRK